MDKSKRWRRDWLKPYAWSAPSLLLIFLMVVFPILYSVLVVFSRTGYHIIPDLFFHDGGINMNPSSLQVNG